MCFDSLLTPHEKIFTNEICYFLSNGNKSQANVVGVVVHSSSNLAQMTLSIKRNFVDEGTRSTEYYTDKKMQQFSTDFFFLSFF